jgi:hypothetical protein
MTTKENHTILPWNVTDDSSIVSDKFGYPVADCGYMGSHATEQEDCANANFIVRSCNFHAELLEACKGLLNLIETLEYDGEPVRLQPEEKFARKVIEQIEQTDNKQGL